MKFNNLIDKYISNIYEDVNLGGILNAAAVIADGEQTSKNPGNNEAALRTSAKTVVTSSKRILKDTLAALIKAGMK